MRAGRLLSILLLLQTRGRMSATALAQAMEVSVRTIHRDIEQLGAAGVPVYALRGRDGGFALVDGWRTQLTGLTPSEADALLFAGLPGAAAELGFGAQLDTAELKLVASLPGPSPAADAFRLRARFHLDPIGWFTSAEPVAHLETVAAATWAGERLALTYESWTAMDDRVVDPLGLVLKAGVWYLVASSRGRPRTFRLSNVLAAASTGQSFERPDGFDLATFWRAHAEAYERSRHRSTARIRVSPDGLAQLGRMGRAVAEAAVRATASPDGWFELTIPIETSEHAAGQLFRLGAGCEVLEPADLRAAMARTAAELASLYGVTGPRKTGRGAAPGVSATPSPQSATAAGSPTPRSSRARR